MRKLLIILLTLTITMADAKQMIPFVKKWEGGYGNHPADKGGPTNMGVTIATFQHYYGKNKTANDLKNMTEEQWLRIFKDGFWNKWRADEIESQSIAHLLVDWVWASGLYGIKYPQRVLGVKDDGIVGPKTLAAINNYPNKKELFDKLWNRRKQHFEAIVKNNPSQKVFLKGWLNRLNDIKFVS